MRSFFAFVKKEFYHIFRDLRTIMILILIPIAQILLFGFAMSSEVKNINAAIFYSSNDSAVKSIIGHFSASKYFNIHKIIKSKDELDNAFGDGKISLIIIFQDNFEKRLVKDNNAKISLIIDASDPNKASMINIYSSSIISSSAKDLSKVYNGGSQPDFRITPDIKMLYNPQGKSSYNFVPGLLGMVLMLICAMMTSISIVREKETGTMELLLTSPLKPILIILAKVIPYFLISLISLICILLISVFVLDMAIHGSVMLLISFCMLYIILSLSIGILVSSLVKNQVTAMLMSGMVLMMPVMMLSGMMFPIESMPKILQWVSAFIPARWFIIGIKKVMIEGQGFSSIIQETAILTSFCFVVIVVSLRKFKNRLD